MAKKRSSRRKGVTRKRKSSHRNSVGGFLLFITTRLLTGLAFSVLILLVYLDAEIRQGFSENIHSQPAHVYTRPMQLSPGTRLSPTRLVKTLRRSGYRSVTQISEPGEFVLSNNVIDVFIRQFDTGVSSQNSRAARIFFKGDTISKLVDHATASNINQVTVEPLMIGSLQLGPYKDRISLSLHQMPELLIRALLVMEDRKFESHLGVDPRGIFRALWSNLRDGKAVQGGSTLTQQLVKNLFLSPERTISRKAIEALMAVMMELRFSKAEILELYLNEVFLGQSGNRAVHGFALASEHYFGRPVDQLKLHESALLVSIIPAPSYYNPTRHPERALKRRNLVLKTLADVESISASTAAALSSLPLGIVEHKAVSTSDFPAYLDYVHRQLRQYYSTEVLRKNGLKLYTSLDAGLQSIAQQGLSETLSRLEQQKNFKPGTLQGAVIIVDPKQGEILALVGDRVKGYSGFNRAIDALRPIGSLVKPAVYLTALKQPGKFSLTTILDDSPLDLTQEGGETWSPQNYDKTFRGPIPLYQGLIHSYNVPTVRLGLKIGIDNVIETMHQLGIERDIANYPSTLLGANQHSPLEVAQMYQTLANYGVQIPLRSIQTIQNHRSETVARFPVSRLRVVEENSAYLIDFALKQVVRSGTAAGLARSFGTGLGLRGKTGTTDNFRDSWFAGYSENLLAVVWVGRDDNRPANLSGSAGAMRVWENVMSKIHLQEPADYLAEDIIFADIDPETGQVANSRCPRVLSLPYIEGSQPEEFAPCSGLSTQMKSWFSIKKAPSNKNLPVELLPGR